MHPKNISLVTLILVLFSVGVASQNLPTQSQDQSSPLNLSDVIFSKDEQIRLEKIFSTKGSAEAVTYFKNTYGGYDEETKHVLEHFLGEKIYKYDGFKGLTLCPTSLLFGCYHGFFAKAFSEEGRNFINQAEDACRFTSDFFKASGCIHGLGHGFLALEGNHQILAALKDCDASAYSVPFGNEMCYTGVFMEYNESRKTISLANIDRQIYQPCIEVPENYQPACYLQLPQWWNEVFGNNFSKMGERCGKVEATKNQENCFRSIGMVITRETKADNSQIGEFCEAMPASGIGFCLEESAKLLSILKKLNPLSPCASLDEPAQTNCITNVKKFMCDSLLICE